MKRVWKLGVRLDRSYGAKWGPDSNSLLPIPFGTGSVPPQLFTGDVVYGFEGDYDRSGYTLIRQDLPMPMTVVAIMPREQPFDL